MIKIKNFQSHTDTELDIKQNGINVIVGESDSGKSSIIRSLELLALGRPSGDKFRTHGTTSTEVEWKGVKRVRTATTSKYFVDSEEFRALRTDVPRQVTERLRLTEVNFRSQHSPYHMLTETPGQRARAMNDLADLGLIDYTSAAVKSIARDNKMNLDSSQTKFDNLQTQIEGLQWSIEADKELGVIESLETHLYTLEILLKRYEDYVSRLEQVEDRLRKFPSTKPDIEAINSLIAEYNSFEYADLEARLDKLEEYTTDLDVCPDPASDIELLSRIEFPNYRALEKTCEALTVIESRQWPDNTWINELEEIQMAYKNYQDVIAKCEDLLNLMEKFESVNDAYDKGVLTEQEMIEKFNKALEEAGVCPLCGSSTCEEK